MHLRADCNPYQRPQRVGTSPVLILCHAPEYHLSWEELCMYLVPEFCSWCQGNEPWSLDSGGLHGGLHSWILQDYGNQRCSSWQAITPRGLHRLSSLSMKEASLELWPKGRPTFRPTEMLSKNIDCDAVLALSLLCSSLPVSPWKKFILLYGAPIFAIIAQGQLQVTWLRWPVGVMLADLRTAYICTYLKTAAWGSGSNQLEYGC